MSLIRYPVKRNVEPENQIKTLQLVFGYRPMGISRIQACKAQQTGVKKSIQNCNCEY